ncbi:hypothetical protein [Marinisporobacter balticus]|uniref:Uncharacterized protein n=1 Tax=Marinisporobacter balticus TaxID=2018667 RepID=A0A4R2KG84_9FIRM|nr:hypothetical protein [Marinisporobacter balticus]TCO68978.1 hypothetical protein EV214_1364 [Marinisporobacter balticus]
MLKGIRKRIKGLVPKVLNAGKKAVKKVKTVAKRAVKKVKRAISAVPKVCNAIKNKGKKVLKKVASAVPRAISAVKKKVKKAVNKGKKVVKQIKKAVDKKIKSINKKINEVTTDIKNKNERILDKVKAEWEKASCKIIRGTTITGAYSAVHRENRSFVMLDFLLQARKTIIEKYPILNGYTNLGNKAINGVKNVTTDIGNTIDNMKNAMDSAKNNSVSGVSIKPEVPTEEFGKLVADVKLVNIVAKADNDEYINDPYNWENEFQNNIKQRIDEEISRCMADTYRNEEIDKIILEEATKLQNKYSTVYNASDNGLYNARIAIIGSMTGEQNVHQVLRPLYETYDLKNDRDSLLKIGLKGFFGGLDYGTEYIQSEAIAEGIGKAINIAKNSKYITNNRGVIGKGTGEAAYKYNMIENPGPLAEIPGNPASNFAGGKYNTIVLEEDMILYRAGKSGGGKNSLGQWFTEAPAESAIKVRIETAVKPQWIDPKTGVLTGSSPLQSKYAVKIPAGTTIYKGPVGYQGGIYQGGQDVMQTFVEKPWLIKGVETLSETPLP